MAESPGRVEAFSDGVFAIAITLLILEIRVPQVDHGLWSGLLQLWPSYVAFLLSFVVILMMWVNHHELLRMADGINYPFLFANGLLLLTVTFVPFPTAVLAAYLGKPEEKAAVAFYCGTFFVNGLIWNLLFHTIVRSGLLRSGVSAETVANVRRAYLWGSVVYFASTLLALVRPVMGLLLNVSLWGLWIRLGYRAERSAE
ncbi:MAG TPA: TMEM175 family protein [Gemmatimonadales bacterium]|nr:TMEM175 family protein [Gemmatimonadales bacterium]